MKSLFGIMLLWAPTIFGYTSPIYPTVQTPAVSTNNVVPTKLEVGNKFYEGNLKGLRKYLEKDVKKNPELYDQLDPKLAKLERQRILGLTVMGVGLAGGIGVCFWAVDQKSQCQKRYPNDLTNSNRENCEKPMDQVMIASGIAMLGGWLVGSIISPGRDEFMDFVNDHNELNKESPLKFQLGLVPSEPIGVKLSYQF
jgi:hypothetical protein